MASAHTADPAVPTRGVRALLITLMAAALLATLAVPAEAHHSKLHWGVYKSDSALKLRVLDSTSGGYYDKLGVTLNDTLKKWNYASHEIAMRRQNAKNHASYRKACPKADGYMRVCDYDYGATNWSGKAVVYYNSYGHITAVRVLLNRHYLVPWGISKWPLIRRVMCHEVGHGLGLDHSAHDGSCLKHGSTSEDPNVHDSNQLNKDYSHRHWGRTYVSW